MAQSDVVVGIDVSKDILDVAFLPGGMVRQFPNDRAGLRALVSVLRKAGTRLTAFEATGGYERGLLQALSKAGLTASRVNPARVRKFADACGLLAKTDRLDAQIIARFAQTLAPRPTLCDPNVEELAHLVTARRQIVDTMTLMSNQLAMNPCALVKRLVTKQLKLLAENKAQLERAMAKLVAAHDPFADDDRIMRSMPGIGTVASTTLLALMPELGSMKNRPAASLAGVAPFVRQSGRYKGESRIFGGRSAVRQVLYMAAVSAIRSNPTFQSFYKRLRDKGKASKLAIVAVIRKIVTTLNVMLRTRQTWKPAAIVHPLA